LDLTILRFQFHFMQSRTEQASGASTRLTVYDCIHDHCWGNRDVILRIILKVILKIILKVVLKDVLDVVLDIDLRVILIVCHGCVHIAVELTLVDGAKVVLWGEFGDADNILQDEHARDEINTFLSLVT
jgi:hypothetical protein